MMAVVVMMVHGDDDGDMAVAAAAGNDNDKDIIIKHTSHNLGEVVHGRIGHTKGY